MESGAPSPARVSVFSQQGFAMANAQFKSESILNPYVPSPEETSHEHKTDLSGRFSKPTYSEDVSLPSAESDEAHFIEGSAFRDVNVELSAGAAATTEQSAPSVENNPNGVSAHSAAATASA